MQITLAMHRVHIILQTEKLPRGRSKMRNTHTLHYQVDNTEESLAKDEALVSMC